MSDRGREPIFNAPGVVVGLVALLVAVHLARLLLPDETDLEVLLAGALIPGRLSAEAPALPGGQLAAVTQYVTHMLLHGDFGHLLINCAWLLVFGSAMARRLGPLRFLGFTLACGLVAALAFSGVHYGELKPMVGASGAVSGLMGGVFRLLFAALDQGGIRLLNERPDLVRAPPLMNALADRRVLTASGAIIALNIALALGLGTLLSEGGIAWEAHIAGYLAGLLGFGLFDRPVPPPPAHTLH